MPLDPAVALQPQQARLQAGAEAVAEEGGPFRRLVYHGLGSGKTLSGLAIAGALGVPHTVIAPASLRSTHRRERERFTTPDFPESQFRSYAQVGRGALAEDVPDLVLADEAHRIAGPGQEAAAARDALLKARHAVLMTGTPVRNRAEEFGPLLGILTGQPMTQEEFARRYVGQERHYPGGFLGRLRGEAPVHREILRREGELRKLLAGKIDFHATSGPVVPVFDETVDTEMGSGQADLYKAMIGELPWALRQKLRWNYPLNPDELRRARMFLAGPRQIALSDYPYRPDANPYQAFLGSGKLKAAFTNLKKVLDPDARTRAVVYSNFPRAGLAPYAAALQRAGIPYGFFHGGVSPTDRQKLVDDFNSGRVRVALVGPAGSEGISLRGAQLIQLLDPHWHPVRDAQAAARVLRFDSHTDLPEELRRVKIERYRSRVPPSPIGRLLRQLGFTIPGEPAADDYLTQMSAEKGQAVEPLLGLLREVGTKRSADEADTDTDSPRPRPRPRSLRRGLRWFMGEMTGVDRADLAKRPFKTLGRGAFNVATTPVFAPFTRRKYPWATKWLSRAANALTYGTTAAGVLAAPFFMRDQATNAYWEALLQAGTPYDEAREAADKFREGFFPRYVPALFPKELGGEESPLADYHRDLMRQLAEPYAHQQVYNALTYGPGALPRSVGRYASPVLDTLRSLTPAGAAVTAGLHAFAEPANQEEVINTIAGVTGEHSARLGVHPLALGAADMTPLAHAYLDPAANLTQEMYTEPMQRRGQTHLTWVRYPLEHYDRPLYHSPWTADVAPGPPTRLTEALGRAASPEAATWVVSPRAQSTAARRGLFKDSAEMPLEDRLELEAAYEQQAADRFELTVKWAAEFAPGIPSRRDYGDLAALTPGSLHDLIVQEHLARRAGRHFDVRLGSPEMGLLSWAARKGLPEEPGAKHLAVRQPVHTHAYGGFEGEIPSGYGAGTVKTHRKGRVLVTDVGPGHVRFTTAGGRYPERYLLRQTKDHNWLLINATKAEAVPHEKVPYTKVDAADAEEILGALQPGSSVQAKIDGAASLTKLYKDHAEVLSYRQAKGTGRPIVHTERVVGGRLPLNLPPALRESVVRGELYGVDPKGKVIPPQRLGGLLNAAVEKSLAEQRAAGISLRNLLFDVQQLGRKPIPATTPYAERLRLIREQILPHLPAEVFHAPEEATTPEAALALWRRVAAGKHPLSQEGVVVHPPLGKPTKVKLLEEQDVHVRDVFPGLGKYQGVGAGGFRYSLTPEGPVLGEVGTGLSDELRRQMHEDPGAFVGRVARVRSQGAYPSGALRAPALLALHEDYPFAPAGKTARSDDIATLLQAKQLSDAGHYQAKTFLVRDHIRKNPGHWRIDSDQGHTVGLTHRSGFRLHLPKTAIADLLPALRKPPLKPPPIAAS